MIDDEELAPAEEGQDDDSRAEADDDAGGDEARQAIEAQAREQGWRPIDEWRGDKSRWMDADKFVERTKPAKIRESVDELARENRELKRERAAEKAEFEARAARLEKVTQIAMQRQREQMLANVKAAKRQAFEIGDVDAYDQLEAHEGKVVAQFATEDKDLAPVQPAQKPQQPNAPDPTIHGWVSANAAVRYNDAKWTAAQAFFTESEQLNPDASVEDHLAHVETRINEVWPGTVLKPIKPNGKANGNGHADPPRQKGPQLEGSGRMAARGGVRQKGFAEIPAEERRIYKDYIKEGLFKDEADAAKAHWS